MFDYIYWITLGIDYFVHVGVFQRTFSVFQNTQPKNGTTHTKIKFCRSVHKDQQSDQVKPGNRRSSTCYHRRCEATTVSLCNYYGQYAPWHCSCHAKIRKGSLVMSTSLWLFNKGCNKITRFWWKRCVCFEVKVATK